MQTGKMQILVVESECAGGSLTGDALKAVGCTDGLHRVSDGSDALLYLRQQGKYVHADIPDLIFIDLSLAKDSGLEVLRAIKSTPALTHIPVVVASGSDDPDTVRAVYARNGNCFIRKPGEFSQFQHAIEKCFQFWSSVVTLSPKARTSAASK